MKEFVKEITENALAFGAEFVFLSPMDDGHLLAESIDKARSVYMRAVSARPHPASYKGFLGNLDLLRKLCSMEQIMGSDGKIEVRHGPASDNTDTITDLIFKGPRMTAQYKASDQRIATAVVTMPKTYPTQFDVTIQIAQNQAKELRDAVSLQATALGKNKEECFVYMGAENGVFEARFPYHETGVTIGLGPSEKKIADVPFASDILIRVLDTATKGNGECSLSLTAMASRVAWKSSEVEFMALLPKSVIPTRTL